MVTGKFSHAYRVWHNIRLMFSYPPDHQHMDSLIATLSLEDARPVSTPFTRDTGKGQANTLSELSVTEQAIYMTGSSLFQYIALDRMDVVFVTKEVRDHQHRKLMCCHCCC